MAWTFNAPLTTLSDTPPLQSRRLFGSKNRWADSLKITTPSRSR
jgi:hypothetical protein